MGVAGEFTGGQRMAAEQNRKDRGSARIGNQRGDGCNIRVGIHRENLFSCPAHSTAWTLRYASKHCRYKLDNMNTPIPAPPQNPIQAVTHPDPYPYYRDLVLRRPLYYDETLRLLVAASADRVMAV